MRNIYSLDKDWIFSPVTDTEDFEDTGINLPFIHSADTMPEAFFQKSWKTSEKDEGLTAYLCFSQLSGDAEIYDGDTLVGTHKGSSAAFNILLSDSITLNKTFDIKIKAAPGARADGKFVFAAVKLVTISSSHFDMESTGPVHVISIPGEGKADIHILAKIVKPNNYDVAAFTVIDRNGESIASKTAKPTAADTVITIENPDLWDGQSDTSLYTLKAVLQRDSTVLDEIEVSFGIRDISLSEDGFLHLNNIKLPLSGVMLTDCSRVKTDMKNFRKLDANCFMSSMMSAKRDFLSECDKNGDIFWYALPFRDENDIELLKEFLTEKRNHPSLAFVLCHENADDSYRENFIKTVHKYAPGVFAAVSCSIDRLEFLDPGDAEIIAIDIPYQDDPGALMGVEAKVNAVAEKYPGKFFAVIAKSPDLLFEDAASADEWHIKLWDAFCRTKGIIAYIADTFTDGKTENAKRGLISADRKTFSDAFWFYKTQFSAEGFIKLSSADCAPTFSKTSDIRCFTNLDSLRLLINGKDKKYKAEKLSDGVYVYRNIKLKKGENTVEVSAGDECDSAVIIKN